MSLPAAHRLKGRGDVSTETASLLWAISAIWIGRNGYKRGQKITCWQPVAPYADADRDIEKRDVLKDTGNGLNSYLDLSGRFNASMDIGLERRLCGGA
ncbi:hypothetical protein FJ988_19670 [Mesorhizobium sp. CU3]|uniref:hypothetical protein n=1 Tax=unclassified Mesorhizobium TaxID=325217 RepID=UPI00112DA1E1|nr:MULTISPECIES: hypothetical protein [unclassified Mesorhizobium]TPN81109.1 hypothetical protein FJ988_19670 [Mesorhizobium sp. CU3]